MFSGHEHNFQHSHVDGIDYFVSGAAGRVRRRAPHGFIDAHTCSWSAECHFLLVQITGREMIVRAVGEPLTGSGEGSDVTRRDPDGQVVTTPIIVHR